MVDVVQMIDVNKNIGKKRVLNNINLKISEGIIYGLVGKNGAGKTTLMKLLCGILYPTNGNILLFNSSNLLKGRQEIGSLIEEPALYPNMNSVENLVAHGILISNFNKNDIPNLLEIVGLKGMEEKKIKEYSLGMKQRLAIALALLGKPKLLILDEPMNGLDPVGMKHVRELLLRLNKEYKVSILVSSHIIDELAIIVDVYGVIKEGKLIKELVAGDFEHHSMETIKIQILHHDIDKIFNLLKKGNFGKYHYKGNGYFVFYEFSEEQLRSLLLTLINNEIRILQMTRKENKVEDYIISLLEDNFNEKAANI